MGGFVAIDWGTTNRRIYVIAPTGTVVHSDADDRGILSLATRPFDEEIDAIRTRFPDLPILLVGMIGSNRGWREAPYAPAPAGLADLAERCVWIEPGRIAIVPGVSRGDDDRADVMRGEEVQVFGAVAAGLVPASALLCQPGTHAKWIDLVDGRITDFTTAMTGELFALLRHNGILSGDLDGVVEDGPAFRAGVARGGARDLLRDLFGARAARLLGIRRADEQASYVSGLLIGSDVAARLHGRGRDVTVHVLADGPLGALYAGAIDASGANAVRIDAQTAFVAGANAIWEQLA